MRKFAEFFHKTQPGNKLVWIIATVLIVVAIAISAGARYKQLDTWKQNSQYFYTQGTPMMTTLDAYKFLRHAKEYKNGTFNPKVQDKMIFYPDDSPFPDTIPLLSVIIEKFSSITGMSLYDSGIYIIPVISSLFIIPLAIYFIIIGLPALGILGGIVGTFAPMYFLRSGIGRVDTDGGVLFFLFLSSLFLLIASRGKSKKIMFIFSALLGLSINLFYMWYQHGMFNLIYLVMLIICLAVARAKIRDIIISCVLFIIFSNPIFTYNGFSQLANAVNIYIFHGQEKAYAIFPNVYNTIGEASREKPMEILASVTVNPSIAIVGIIGCILLVIGYFKYLIPLLPVVALAIMSFVSASRFSMFLGPIVGVGIAYIFVMIFAFIKIVSKKRKMLFMAIAPFVAVIIIGFAINAAGFSAIKSIPGPSILPQTFQVFKDMKTELPKNSAIYTWWDYGLAIADASGFPVFHSGMTQQTPKTWIIAKSFISDPKTLYNIVSYLDNYGVAEIMYMSKNKSTLDEIEKHVYNFNEGPSNNADYVMITEDMVSKFSAIAYLATWKENGELSPKIVFQHEVCAPIGQNEVDCGGNKINLQLGLINNNAPIKEMVTINSGHVIKDKKFNFNEGYDIIITGLYPDGRLDAYILNQTAFDSSFVQLYFFGKPDPKMFQLTVDKFPFARIYKVLKKPEKIEQTSKK